MSWRPSWNDFPPMSVASVSSLALRASGYWLEPVEGVGTSVLVFETKEHADQAAQYPVPPMPGVIVLDLIIREVFAHI
jgi:hypothetical protein